MGQRSTSSYIVCDELTLFNINIEDVDAATMVTSLIVNSLMKTPNFMYFFDQLRFLEESRKEVPLSLVKIAGE